MKEIKERFGSYILTEKIDADKDFAQVKVEDVSDLRFPLLFSVAMNIEQASAYLEMFKMIGYVEVR